MPCSPSGRSRPVLRRTGAVRRTVLRGWCRLLTGPSRTDRAQGTVEYALVLLGAAAVALLLVAWVARTDLIGRLFDTVVGKVLGRV